MKWLNDIKFHEYHDQSTWQYRVRAQLSFNAQMAISDGLRGNAREMHRMAYKELARKIQHLIYEDVIEELHEVREQLFAIPNDEVVPVLDTISALITKLREGDA